jgi:hypothetical protein
MQKDGAVVLSHARLKHYLTTNLKAFDKIKRTHLTNQWIVSGSETRIERLYTTSEL